MTAKDLKIYAKVELKERCAVSIFEFYLSLIPPEGPFYRRPLSCSPPKYSIQVIGVNKLNVIVKFFSEKAGFKGYFTNHSGVVTCATELYKQNIDEQLIMQQTGHRSVDGVRKYKRSSDQHALQVTDVLQPPNPKKFKTSETISFSKKENTTTVSEESAVQDCETVTTSNAKCYPPTLPPVFTFKAAPHRTFILTTSNIIIFDNIRHYHSYSSELRVHYVFLFFLTIISAINL